ncbi:MAG: class I SAM-dependent methyltransferase [Spirochaetia bacterium]
MVNKNRGIALDEIGWFYKLFIDPLLENVRKDISQLIPKGRKVLDIGCGTGALALMLSRKAEQVIGIDSSLSMIGTAKASAEKAGAENLQFFQENVFSFLENTSGQYDYAVLSFFLHQIDDADRIPLITQLKHYSDSVLIADYNLPFPGVLLNCAVTFIEWAAGTEHYRNFRGFANHGGVDYIKKYFGGSSGEHQERSTDLYVVTRV